eukprot:jgi/Botrbrau1/21076/Bobra.0144s0074.2
MREQWKLQSLPSCSRIVPNVQFLKSTLYRRGPQVTSSKGLGSEKGVFDGDSGIVCRASQARDAASPAGNKLPPNIHATIPAERLRQGRTIIVGDIHGCVAEFQELLDTLQYEQGRDILILAGDLVNKGPASVQVVQLARKVGALAVRGNHDDGAVRACNVMAEGGRINRPNVWGWVANLAPEDVAYLSNLPFTICLPPFKVVVVHAGLIPGRSLEEQRLVDLIKMRDVVPTGVSHPAAMWFSSETHRENGLAWGSVWAGSMHVFYGHDAVRCLQLHRYATGLDTGCCYGGRLTAAVIPPLGSLPSRKLSWRTGGSSTEPAPETRRPDPQGADGPVGPFGCCKGLWDAFPRWRGRKPPTLDELGAQFVSVQAQAVYLQPEVLQERLSSKGSQRRQKEPSPKRRPSKKNGDASGSISEERRGNRTHDSGDEGTRASTSQKDATVPVQEPLALM